MLAVTGKIVERLQLRHRDHPYDLVAATSWEKRYATSASAGSKDDVGRRSVSTKTAMSSLPGSRQLPGQGHLHRKVCGLSGTSSGRRSSTAPMTTSRQDGDRVERYDRGRIRHRLHLDLDAKHDIYTVKYTDPVEPQTTVPVVAWEKNFTLTTAMTTSPQLRGSSWMKAVISL